MTHRQTRIVVFYLVGFAQVFGWIFGVSVVLMWLLQVLALSMGLFPDGGMILTHLVLMLSFVAFFPGQAILTHRREGPDGRIYVIVGSEREDRHPGA